MGEDFQVGDVVVCVDARTPAMPNSTAPAEHSELREGSMYRVRSLWNDSCFGPCLTLNEVEARSVNGGFLCRRFRKLPKADEEFTASLRARKPSRNRVPA